MIKPQYIWQRSGRWLRRTGWLLKQIRADLGFGVSAGPAWRRDNPFLVKSSRAETRRQGLMGRLLATVAVLGGLLLGGRTLQNNDPAGTASFTSLVFGTSFPVVLFVAVSFVHTLLIANARTALAVSLADEARRGTLPDLLMTPLRRAEMLLAMGVGPARSAFMIALAGLPVYALLEQFGGPLPWEIGCLYLLFALLSYQPPAYAVPALSGLAQTPEALPGQFAAIPNRRAMRRASYLGLGFPLILGVLFAGRFLGALGGGWLTHLFSALSLPLLSGFSFLIFFSWPYYTVQILSARLPFFHVTLSPIFYVLPLVAMQWAGSALSSAAALSAGSLPEMHRLPIWTRAQTLRRWTMRAAGLCALAVVWRAWVESGDTGSLASDFAVGPGWNAAGLLLLLGGFSLPNVCGRALAMPSQIKEPSPRASARVLRRAMRRSLRPLGVALGVFLFACLLGGLSPFAVPVYQTAGKILLAAGSTVIWAVGIRRALPQIGKWIVAALLYAVPFLGLSVPVLSAAAAFSPASAWVRLFVGGPALVMRFPLWHLAVLPPFAVCVAGPLAAGLALIAATSRPQKQAAPVKPALVKRVAVRHEARTAALMAWITSRTDNPLFTYEMRVRTRSGRWFLWLTGLPLAFASAVVVALAAPGFIGDFSFLSLFHFFGFQMSGTDLAAFSQLASLLLMGQCYFLGMRGQVIGQELMAKDRQRGTWGSLLISPLTITQIFWGKVFGQTAAVGAIWAAAGLACLLLYGLASPLVEVGPALAAWSSGQLFVAALFILGVGLGTVMATFPKVQKTFRGLSTLLFVLVVGASVYAQFQWFPADMPGDWQRLALRLFGGGVFGLLLAALLFWLAQWRLTRLRGHDITVGDGLG